VTHPSIVDSLYDLSDDELIESWREAEPAYKNALYVLRAHEAELVRRMGDRLVLETDKGSVVRSPKLGPYQWDREALHMILGDRLSKEMWAEIERPVTEVKIMTAKVQKYAKQLGISESDLSRCYFRAEHKQDLEYHPPLLAQLEASVADVKAKRGEKV